METHKFMIQLVIILFSARIIGEIATYLKTPSVIGELIAGILIGPSVFGLVEISPSIQILAELGVILLLFEVGIETNVMKLTSAGIKASVVAIGGVVLPFLFGFIISYYVLIFSLLTSLFIGSTLTATSIGITLRVLRDLKKQNRNEAQIIIGAAVLDDIIGIILIAMLYELSQSGNVNFWNIGKILSFIIIFFFISPFIAKFVSTIIKLWDEQSEIPGVLPATVVSLILLFSWIAHEIGAPELLGGFAVGLALSKHFFFPFGAFLSKTPKFNRRIEDQMKPIIHLFTPIFFVTIGLSINLKSMNLASLNIWIITTLLLITAIVGKLASGFFLIKESLSTKLIVGTAMIPRGEVGLIFANIGLTAGVFKDDIYASIILVIVLTTLLAPLVLRYIYSKEVYDLNHLDKNIL